MAKDYEKDLSKMNESINGVLLQFKTVLGNLSKSTNTVLHELLWQLRADLEFLIIDLKNCYNKENKTERWQKDFLEKSKGTSSKSKAIDMLTEYKLTDSQIKSFTTKNPDIQFKHLWKLKEKISSILSAFATRNNFQNNGLDDNGDEEIFEI